MPSTRYEPTWRSLREHPTPQLFRDAKFGIYTHWGGPKRDIVVAGAAHPRPVAIPGGRGGGLQDRPALTAPTPASVLAPRIFPIH